MQLNITTDYAIRAMLLLAEREERLSIATISEEMKIPKSYLPSIMKKLGQRGFVSVQRGVTGGWRLEKGAAEISLFDLIETMETTTRINCCIDEETFCSRFSPSYCAVQHQLAELQSMVEDFLKNVSLASLIEDQSILSEKMASL